MFLVLFWRNPFLNNRKYDTANEQYVIYWSSDSILKMPLWIQPKNHVSRKWQNKQHFVLQVPHELHCTKAGLPSKLPQVTKMELKATGAVSSCICYYLAPLHIGDALGMSLPVCISTVRLNKHRSIYRVVSQFVVGSRCIVLVTLMGTIFRSNILLD